MADLDRITELLLSDEEMPDVYYSMLENASDTEPTLDPLNQMIANQKAQDDFLMTMAMLPKNAARSAINVGRQRFMLPVDEIARKTTTRSGAPRVSPRLPNPEIERLRLKQAKADKLHKFLVRNHAAMAKRGERGPTYPSPSGVDRFLLQPVADPLYKQLGISDTAMNIFGGAGAGVGAYATAGMIYDNLDEETKAHLRKLLEPPTK